MGASKSSPDKIDEASVETEVALQLSKESGLGGEDGTAFSEPIQTVSTLLVPSVSTLPVPSVSTLIPKPIPSVSTEPVPSISSLTSCDGTVPLVEATVVEVLVRSSQELDSCLFPSTASRKSKKGKVLLEELDGELSDWPDVPSSKSSRWSGSLIFMSFSESSQRIGRTSELHFDLCACLNNRAQRSYTSTSCCHTLFIPIG